MESSVPAIRCRQIGEADIAGVAALLGRGFPNRTRQFWSDALARLTRREPPPGFPKYGYLLESGDVPVGALLLICSTMREDGRLATRCNLSSWYVEPAYRAYATLLVSQALADKNATYTNVSAAPHTWPIIEAQGFSRYCDGVFVAVPMLKDLFGGSRRARLRRGREPDGELRCLRARHPPASRRAWLHQPVVRERRTRLPVRFPAPHRQARNPVRAVDLLPRRCRLRALRRADRALPGMARQTVRHRRFRTTPFPD